TPLYNYLVREGSMTRTKYNKHSVDKVLAYYDNLDLIEGRYSNCLELLKNRLLSSIITNLVKIKLLSLDKVYYEEIIFYNQIEKEYYPKLSLSNCKLYLFNYFFLNRNIDLLKIKIFKDFISRIINLK
ncbi:MAG: hypothetical protein RR623_08355, partial [Bacilli bacterium]